MVKKVIELYKIMTIVDVELVENKLVELKKSLLDPLGSDSDNQVSATLNERRIIVKMNKDLLCKVIWPHDLGTRKI